MKCHICGKPVVLIPSATDRARRYGGAADDYTALFPAHTACAMDKRDADTRELMRRLNRRTIK